MSTEVLKLDCDNLVIGAGMAGLVAALRLKGKTIVASAGMGATAISSGVLSSPNRDPVVDKWFLETMYDTSCRYVEGRCISDLGAYRSGLVQEIVNYDPVGGKPLMVSLDGVLPSGARNICIPDFGGRSCMEIAKLVDTDDRTLELISGALGGTGSSVLVLPPVLGITRTDEIRRSLERVTGARIFEYVTAPSVHGLRLLTALRKIADSRKDITVLDTARVNNIQDCVTGHMGTKGKREFVVGASTLIIATGGPMTGLRVEGDSVIEPLTGEIVGDVDQGLNKRFISDHPLMGKGIGTQPEVSGPFRTIRAVGGIASGFGLYEALQTGYYAGSL